MLTLSAQMFTSYRSCHFHVYKSTFSYILFLSNLIGYQMALKVIFSYGQLFVLVLISALANKYENDNFVCFLPNISDSKALHTIIIRFIPKL